jgi:hypothetical protein
MYCFYWRLWGSEVFVPHVPNKTSGDLVVYPILLRECQLMNELESNAMHIGKDTARKKR